MFERILTVCTGNICRSPLAEALLRLQLAADRRDAVARVRSAGIGTKEGRTTDETVLFIARDQAPLRTMLEAHRSQPLTPTLTWWADLILVMEPRHARHVEKLDPSARDKIHLLGRWSQPSTITDPYLKHESEYREVHAQIAQSVAAWRERING